MIINRDNYENFFLLYVDGELAPADMKKVEEFTAANPDLLHELDMLKETVLPAEGVSFDSSFLLKGSLTDEQLQEKLLLYVDDELPASQEAELTGLLSANKEAAAEYEFLKKTKLDAGEKIIFEDKHLLYRKEKDNVVIGRFVRWAAAAVLTGFGLFLGYDKLNQKHPTEVASGKPVKEIKINKGENSTGTNASQNNFADSGNPNSAENDPVMTAQNRPLQNNRPDEQITARTKDSKSSNSNTVSPVPTPVQTPEEKNLQPSTASLAKNNEGSISAEKNFSNPSPPMAELVTPKKTTVAETNIIQPDTNPYAQVASLTDADRSQNKILYMDEDVVRKSKAGGLFRKVKRFVERTAKIKSGNSVAIGAFQFGSD